jgi:hypothetical protein
MLQYYRGIHISQTYDQGVKRDLEEWRRLQLSSVLQVVRVHANLYSFMGIVAFKNRLAWCIPIKPRFSWRNFFSGDNTCMDESMGR